MTTTLRPAEPEQTGEGGVRTLRHAVHVNGRPAGEITFGTDVRFGADMGRIHDLRIDGADQRRGHGTAAALAAEGVLRSWGCVRIGVSISTDAQAAQSLATSLGYLARSRNMAKTLPATPPALPTGSAARPLSAAEYATWVVHQQAEYARELTGRGLSEERAHALSEAENRTFLPDGLDSADTALRVLLHDGEIVGHLWVATPRSADAFVYDVEVVAGHRGRGHGRTLMLLAEREALAAGATVLGLNVFAGITAAERLYESLGYVTTRRHLSKVL